MFTRVAILGLGLIGSSLARALRENNSAGHIAAFDISADALSYAAREGFIDSHHAIAGQAVEHADLVIFASPPISFAPLARDIAPFLKPGTIVTDMGSIKRRAIGYIKPHLPASVHFVPAHPIAGSEHTGPEAGRADLFFGKRVILTPEEHEVMSEPVGKIRDLWESCGAKIDYMPADLHDRIYAYVSHLPQVLAFGAWRELSRYPALEDEFYTRFTRLKHSDATLWADILTSNSDYVNEAIGAFTAFASQIAGELAENNDAAENSNAEVIAGLFPKIVATCLAASASLLQEELGVHPVHYAGAGFADMTAPAVHDPEAALEAISAHHHMLATMLKSLLEWLQELREMLEKESKPGVERLLKTPH